MKNNVAGVAGAARINQLTRADLTRAERHGKRLDATGRSRAINEQPPITTTGLELNALFEQHVAGAFIPKAQSKAMHILIQFPKDLVDGDDAAGMLHHARAFTRRVFGDAAIFADRVDRDERSRHVVDLFVAPKYMKTTKHQEKLAVGMTHHLKLLAKEYGQPTGPHGCARALQTALFEYLRDNMGLEGVRRGSQKQVPGPDWLSAEDQRVEELAGLTAQAQAGIDQAERDKAAARVERGEAEQRQRDRDIAFRAEQAEAARRDADRDQMLAERERQAAEREQAIAEREAEVAMALARAETTRREADEARIVMDAAVQAAQRNVEDSVRDRATARKARDDAEADRVRAAADAQAIVAERNRIAARHQLEEAQLALLARGADNDAGLELRLSGNGFSMRKAAIQPNERVTFEASWSTSLVKLARRLAEALERMRAHALRLLWREQELDGRAAALTAREQEVDRDHRARAAEHAAALADLERRGRELDASEDGASARMAEAESQISKAMARETEANAAVVRHIKWSLAVDEIIDHPDWIQVTGNTIRLDRYAAATIDPKLVATLRETPPNWAMNVILARLDVADRHGLAKKRELDAARSARQLADLVSRAGPVLTPEQQKVAAEVQATVKQSAVAAQAWNAARGTGR